MCKIFQECYFKTLTICEGHVYDETKTRLLAKMTATMIAVEK